MKRTILAASMVTIGACVGCGPPDGGESVGQTDDALSSHRVDVVTTISYAPNSFVIGNAYPGWHDDVQGAAQFSHGPGNPNGVSYRWGYLFGEAFDRCAWIADSAARGTGHTPGSRCGSPQQIDTPYFFATYTNGEHNDNAGDGSVTRMHYAGSGCVDHGGYGNVHPWRVPATPSNARGDVPDGRELRWRYVSKDGDWVLVRDPGASSAGEPNWYFVQRGCVSLSNRN